MERDQILAVLNEPLAQQLLSAPLLARLAYAATDGSPRVIPVGFLWTGSTIVVCTATTAPKVQAISTDPRVALTIDTPGPPAQVLSVRGRAEIEIVSGIPPEYLAAVSKGLSAEEKAQFERQVRAVYKEMARISIEPLWAALYDFGTGRVPRFLQKLIAP
jgi:nitroimidazol reductase NimA-like FMN-containing flavoprotein (pyridoxamine 5'-phosphate oxidase superfamily)